MSKPHGPGRPFLPGNQYGKGRIEGSRNNATIAMEAMLDGEAETIIRKAIELAKTGSESALRLCVERLIPPRRDRLIRFRLPSDLTTAKGTARAAASVLKAVAEGEITTGEAAQLSGLLETRRKTIETSDLELRIAGLERALNPLNQGTQPGRNSQ